MGLDQYLYAQVVAKPKTAMHTLIERTLSEEHAKAMADPEDGYAYLSGWTTWGAAPDPLYVLLCRAAQYLAHEGSPHIDLRRHPDGYAIAWTAFYWRKANAIHRWFVDFVQDGVDDCDRYAVHPELAAELVDRCEKVDADHSLGPELLPTLGGFFFGSTEYNDWYYQDIKETAVALGPRLLNAPKPSTLYYQASW
jgi:hypothetical protein